MPNSCPPVLSLAANTKLPCSQKKSLLVRNTRCKPTERKTFLKVGQMSPNPKDVTPFVIEWVPNLLPRMNIGEITIKFEFGHQKNGQIDPNHSFS